MKWFEASPEIGYLAAGSAGAFVMAMLRTQRWTRKRLAVRLTEAFMCSMLSSAITIGLVQYFEISYAWSVPIGTFTGFIGVDVIHSAIVGWLTYHALKLKEQADMVLTKGSAAQRTVDRIVDEDVKEMAKEMGAGNEIIQGGKDDGPKRAR